MYGITVHNGGLKGPNMNLIGFRHKGLKRLYELDNTKGVPAELAGKLKKLLFALETADI